MYDNNDQQSQTANPASGFSVDNFTPPAALTNNAGADANLPSSSAPQSSTAPDVPSSAASPANNPLDVPELPQTGTPDSVETSDASTPDGLLSVAQATAQTASTEGGDDLLNLKQQALHELTPLVDKLDQTPEEKFRTTMMMIQASDDQTLLKTAYAAAQAISDEKERAQALLDVINEINYFTQHAPAN